MPYAAPVLLAALVVVLVLVAGIGGSTASLLCLVVERRQVGRSIRGRSACVCGTPIPLARNVPVVTWVVQRGRAHCCGASIPGWYAGCEALCSATTVGGLLVGGSTGAVAGLAVGSGATVWLARRSTQP